MFVRQGVPLQSDARAPSGRGGGRNGSGVTESALHRQKRQRMSPAPTIPAACGLGGRVGAEQGGVQWQRDPPSRGLESGAAGSQPFSEGLGPEEPGTPPEPPSSCSGSEESEGDERGGLAALLSCSDEDASASDSDEGGCWSATSFVCAACGKVRRFEDGSRPDVNLHTRSVCWDCNAPCQGPLHDQSGGASGDEDQWVQCSCQARGSLVKSGRSRLRRSAGGGPQFLDHEVWIQPTPQSSSNNFSPAAPPPTTPPQEH